MNRIIKIQIIRRHICCCKKCLPLPERDQEHFIPVIIEVILLFLPLF